MILRYINSIFTFTFTHSQWTSVEQSKTHRRKLCQFAMTLSKYWGDKSISVRHRIIGGIRLSTLSFRLWRHQATTWSGGLSNKSTINRNSGVGLSSGRSLCLGVHRHHSSTCVDIPASITQRIIITLHERVHCSKLHQWDPRAANAFLRYDTRDNLHW